MRMLTRSVYLFMALSIVSAASASVVPKYPQCGVYSLVAFAAELSVFPSDEWVERAYSEYQSDITMLDIKDKLAQLGIETIGVSGSVEMLKNTEAPIIVHAKNNHFFLASSITGSGIMLLDSSGEKKRYEWSEFDEISSGSYLLPDGFIGQTEMNQIVFFSDLMKYHVHGSSQDYDNHYFHYNFRGKHSFDGVIRVEEHARSCGCANVIIEDTAISKGEEFSIAFIMQKSAYSSIERQFADIAFYADDKNVKTVRLEMQIDFVEPLSVSPDPAEVLVLSGEIVKGSVYIDLDPMYKKYDLKLLRDGDLMSAKIIGNKIVFSPVPGFDEYPDSNYEDTIQLALMDNQEFVCVKDMLLQIKKRGLVASNSYSISFGAVDLKKQGRKEVILTRMDCSSFSVDFAANSRFLIRSEVLNDKQIKLIIEPRIDCFNKNQIVNDSIFLEVKVDCDDLVVDENIKLDYSLFRIN